MSDALKLYGGARCTENSPGRCRPVSFGFDKAKPRSADVASARKCGDVDRLVIAKRCDPDGPFMSRRVPATEGMEVSFVPRRPGQLRRETAERVPSGRPS